MVVVMDIHFETAYLNAGGKSSDLEKEDGEYTSSKAQMSWEIWQVAQAVPEWIDVNHKEPPLNTMVLICWSDAPDVEPEKDYMDHDVDHGVNYWANYNDGDEPSHWMLLPEPVAQEQSHD